MIRGIITRLARDVYWFGDFKGRDVPAIEEVAVALRSGEFNYIGMESAGVSVERDFPDSRRAFNGCHDG